ncbi:MAG: AraC family transcriptional regulator [Xanthobacteraceae bacterium]
MVNSISPTPAPPSSLVLSTAALPARDRLPVWREVFGHSMVRLDIEPVKSTFFHAEGELRVLPGAAFAAVSVTPVRVSRTQKLIAEDMADMAFVITADVPFHVTQNGRERMLDAGDAIFLRGGERSTILSCDRAKFTNISVPMGDLTSLLPSCQEPSMTVVSRQSDVLGLLLGYVRLLQARQQPLSDELGRIAASHIRDLMAAMISAEPGAGLVDCERGGLRATRLRAIKADIGGHLCEPKLSIDTIAMRHGISPRYVRKLFQEEQTTFSDFVLLLRLERSRQLLRSPQHAASTVASIAHACGFGDLSYFNRTFRRRYGITPSDLRNGNQVPGGFPW